MIKKVLIILTISGLLSSCATYKPNNVNDLCSILSDEDWYQSALDSQDEWGTPLHVQLAIMHQESKFNRTIRPDMEWFLGFIPTGRPSDAYGYAQALESTWETYIKSTGNWNAKRDEFDDAIHFIGWYTYHTHKKLGVSKWDAKAQYLAYHEGWGGYKRGTYRSKPWLVKVSDKVKRRSLDYARQYKRCRPQLDDNLRGWF